MKAATSKRPSTKPAIKLTNHEKILLVVYRTLSIEGQREVDRALSAVWTRNDPARHARDDIHTINERFGKALKALHAEHGPTEILVYFTNCGQQAVSEKSKGGA